MNDELKFDRARFDAGEMPTRTRDGREVLWCADTGVDIARPIVALIAGDQNATNYTRSGMFWRDTEQSGLDLVHEQRMRKLRIAVCRGPFDDRNTITITSDSKFGDFDEYIAALRGNGRLLHLLEVEVPA